MPPISQTNDATTTTYARLACTSLRLVRRPTATPHNTQPTGAKSARRRRHVQARPASPVLVLVMFAVMLVVFLFSLSVDSLRHSRTNTQLNALPTRIVHVVPGDTLWNLAQSSVASETAPTTEVVNWIREKNGLSSSALRVGQALEVPCAITDE